MSLAVTTPEIRGVPRSAPVEFGLALGGGGARGLAHIPMLEVCDELGIRPGIIAGTSIGALMGAAYCSGLSGKDLREYALQFFGTRSNLIRAFFDRWHGSLWDYWNPLTSSLFTAERIVETIMPPGIATDFKDLKIPLIVVATDFYAQDIHYISEGELNTALAASAALPALMKPVQFGDRILVDGGFADPLPFDLLKDKARIVGAVDVSGIPEASEDRMPSAMELMVTVPHIALRSIINAKLSASRPQVLVRPDVGRFGTLDFLRVEEIWEASLPAKEDFKRQLAGQFGRTETQPPVSEAAPPQALRQGRKRKR
jgi:NTE family protein